MSNNPYEAPNADVEDVPPAFEIPEEVEKRIRNAVGAGIFSGGITALACVGAVLLGHPVLGLDAWGFVDVALILGLTFGIYKKSRTCALIMFVYFVGTKILQIVTTQAYSGLILGLIFSYLYLMGMIGTFQYHKLKREAGQS